MKGVKLMKDFSINNGLLTKHYKSYNYLAMTAYYRKSVIGDCTNARFSSSASTNLVGCQTCGSAT